MLDDQPKGRFLSEGQEIHPVGQGFCGQGVETGLHENVPNPLPVHIGQQCCNWRG